LPIWYVPCLFWNLHASIETENSHSAWNYQNYYVADFVWATSGVIATVTAGVVVRLLGRALVNDLKLLEDFLTILEHILNTLIFTLGGAVWGNIIALEEKSGVWGGREWGYLILLYVLLHVIRVLQFVAIYPITVRIGLKTNWKETAFTIFAGLRGALGITLAIALDNRVAQATGGRDETIHEIHTQQAFACIGTWNMWITSPSIRFKHMKSKPSLIWF
jgi:NhaP-type Na+/H+ or K+/H+ antiporter